MWYPLTRRGLSPNLGHLTGSIRSQVSAKRVFRNVSRQLTGILVCTIAASCVRTETTTKTITVQEPRANSGGVMALVAPKNHVEWTKTQ